MMAMVDSFLAAYSRANGSSPLAWSKGRWPTAVLHSSREPGVVSLKKQYGNQTVEAPGLANGGMRPAPYTPHRLSAPRRVECGEGCPRPH